MSFATPYPGVYLREISSGVRTITGVATSITAFIGRAARGPVNKAVTINNFGDFERIFGGLDVNCLMSYAVRDFYLNGGSQAIIVRLYRSSEAAVKDDTTLAVVREDIKNLFDLAKTTANTTATSTNDVLTAVKQQAAILLNDTEKQKKYMVTYFVEQTELKLKAMVLDKIKKLDPNVEAGIVLATVNEQAKLNHGDFTLIAANEGTWGNHLEMSIDNSVSNDDASYVGVDKEDLFNLTITDTKTNVTETYLNLTLVESSRRVDRILESESSLVRYSGTLDASIPKSNDPENPVIKESVKDENKAVDSQFLGVDEYKGNEKEKTGIYALENADLFNLLCIPPDRRDDDVDTNVWVAAMSYCVKRRAILIVDAPRTWTDARDITKEQNSKLTALGLSGDEARNAAIYFPRVLQADEKRNGQVSDFAPCGIVAGLISKNDAQRGVWTSPAGIDVALNGIRGLKVNLTDEENGMLNPLGINCLRSFPVTGRVIWGARTLRGADRIADEYKYLAVRRTALYIQESLYRGLNWVVFKSNDEPLWAQIRLNVGAFMHNLFRQNAFQGMSPRDAYFVKCDSETTTQNDINSGVVNIVVGFAPLKPAEFVVVKLQQIAGSIQT